ncbi:MAG: radical SAM protein [Chloroflexi bacterium]|nr:radical SAM protein [Chloroflexota bacterium]
MQCEAVWRRGSGRSVLKLSRLPNGEPEIFASIQGEGVTCGVPSVFVRLALCNLACHWCDTRYTWDWAQYDRIAEIIPVPSGEVAERILKRAEGSGGRIRTVVITGGEPLLQQRELVAPMAVLAGVGLRLEVETNGTIVPASELGGLVAQWNVSPKLANSQNQPSRRTVPSALAWFASRSNAYMKLVIAEPGDIDEANALVDRFAFPRDRVLLMPEAADPTALAQRSSWLVERCSEAGYRFSPRLQVLLWGGARGR